MNKPITRNFCLFNLLILPFLLFAPSKELKKALKDLTFLSHDNQNNSTESALPAVVKGSIKKRLGFDLAVDPS